MLAARAADALMAAAPGLGSFALRAIATSSSSSAGVLSHALRRSVPQQPAHYAYPSPGTSVSEPRYFADDTGLSLEAVTSAHAVTSMEPPVHRVSPTKKSAMLHLLITSPRLRLRRGPVGGQRVAQ